MKLRYTHEAIADLISIAGDVRAHNPAAALWVRAAIVDRIQNLVLFPRVGRRQTAAGVRKIIAR
jgi:toxin ParE1/3/4